MNGISWVHLFKKGKLINYWGQHHNGAYCLLYTDIFKTETLFDAAVLLTDGTGEGECFGPLKGLTVHTTGPKNNISDASNSLSDFIWKNIDLNYLYEWPKGRVEFLESHGFERYIPTEKENAYSHLQRI